MGPRLSKNVYKTYLSTSPNTCPRTCPITCPKSCPITSPISQISSPQSSPISAPISAPIFSSVLVRFMKQQNWGRYWGILFGVRIRLLERAPKDINLYAFLWERGSPTYPVAPGGRTVTTRATNDPRGAQWPQGCPVTPGMPSDPMITGAPNDRRGAKWPSAQWPQGRPLTPGGDQWPQGRWLFTISSERYEWYWFGTGALLVGIRKYNIRYRARGVLNAHETESMESKTSHSNTKHISKKWWRILVPLLVLVAGWNDTCDASKNINGHEVKGSIWKSPWLSKFECFEQFEWPCD